MRLYPCPQCGEVEDLTDLEPCPLDECPAHDEAAEIKGQMNHDTQVLLQEIEDELTRARAKFPGKNVTFAALVEEVGELATATFSEPRTNVRAEAVQVAVMAMRMVLDGDHTFDAWRQSKGLDVLVEGGPE